MTVRELIERTGPHLPAPGDPEGYFEGRLPGLGFVSHSSPTTIEATVYEPVVCLILRGRKRTTAGPMAVDFGPGESLVVSHDIPVLSQVTECPYLALILSLDLSLLRSLTDEVEDRAAASARAATLRAGPTDELLIDALGRYASLAGSPAEVKVLAPLVLKEIHFRLLVAPHGGMLRRLLRPDSNASHIQRAVREIRKDFRSALSVPELARRTGMSESAFHRHFKAITGTTPLQYQKAMRLLEARRLISTEGYSVSRAALEVGYASPSQFSREYSREFSVAPRVHAAMG
jgi:AraC-like DNA-binding protein